jgi:apolipoprotein N-acyltransferase
MIKYLLFFLLSLLITGLGQEDFVPSLAPFSAVFGFAIFFWANLFLIDNKKQFFCSAFCWFFGVQLIKLAWIASPEFLGFWIIIFYFFASAFIAMQFAMVAIFIKRGMNVLYILVLASAFTLMEYVRIHILMGFTFNPSGLMLSAFSYSMQMSSLVGVYGMTFLVYLTNLFCLKLFESKQKGKALLILLPLACFPYIFGYFHIKYQLAHAKDRDKKLDFLLVQTFIMQDERFNNDPLKQSYTPLQQWQKVFDIVKQVKDKKFDIVVLPEGVVPYPVDYPLYTQFDVIDLFKKYFGPYSLKTLPALKEPFAFWINKGVKGGGWALSNAYISQGLSNVLKADLFAGFEVVEYNQEVQAFQSMLFFQPENEIFERYDKQILVPLGECLPFKWCEKLANYFGVTAFFTPGNTLKIFNSKAFIGPSICYEETFGNLLLKTKNLGADCFINITNDGWFPGIRLTKQHLAHARLRTVESGLPLIRATTTGVTCGIDSLGRVQAMLDPINAKADILEINMPMFHYDTLYSKTGDNLILGLCFFFIAIFGWRERNFFVKKLFSN